MKLTKRTLGLVALFQGASLSAYAAPDFALSINSNFATGISDRRIADAAVHEHDLNDDASIQGIEAALTVRVDEYLEAFVNVNLFSLPEGGLDSEFEEVFVKLKNLPLGTEIRGGRYLNRIGLENNVHLHGWEFVNANLTTGLLLGEEGLSSDGAELSWIKDYSAGQIHISGSYGSVVTHEEEEGGEEDEEEEALEAAFFSEEVVTVRAQVTYNSNDFFQHKVGLSGAYGENGFGRDSSIIGTDYTFTWRENGLESGGRSFSAGAEYFYRDTEWVDEADPTLRGESSQHSLALRTLYSLNDNWRIGARYEWVNGTSADSFDLSDRERASLALTYSRQLNDDWGSLVRLQYNHDKVDDERSNNAILQLGFSFGGDEIR